jgi:hypothetical protein
MLRLARPLHPSMRPQPEATLGRFRPERRPALYYVLMLSRLGLALGITALVLSWVSIRFRRRWGFSREVASNLSLIGLGLVVLWLMLEAASSRP